MSSPLERHTSQWCKHSEIAPSPGTFLHWGSSLRKWCTIVWAVFMRENTAVPWMKARRTFGPSWPECLLGYFHMQRPRGIASGSHRQVSFSLPETYITLIALGEWKYLQEWRSRALPGYLIHYSASFVTISAKPLPAVFLILIASASI